MSSIANYFFALTRFRASPSEAPYSYPLLAILTVLSILTSAGAHFLSSPIPLTTVIAMAIGSKLWGLGLLYAFLSLKKKSTRWLQAAIAWFGANIVLGLIALTSHLLLEPFGDMAITGMIGLLLTGWVIAITAYVLRLSLDISTAMGIGVALLLIITSGLVEVDIALRLSPDEVKTWTNMILSVEPEVK